MSPLIVTEFVELDLDVKDRTEATRVLAERLAAAGRVSDLQEFLADLAAREAQLPTGLEGGIAVPHARSAAVTVPTVAFARSTPGIDWGASDGPAHLIFLIAAPAGGGNDHMRILASLARKLVNAAFKQSLLDASTPEQVVATIVEAVEGSKR
ncbi:MAG: PTS sugar transporter subunit IIA [Sporichthyaceae bacterium]